MRITRPRFARAALALVYCALASLSASAQTLPEDECARLEDPEAEITCLRAVLAATRQAQQGTQPDAVPATPATVRARQTDSSPAHVAAEEALTGLSSSEPDLGSEQLADAAFVERDTDDREMLVSAITDFRVDRNGRLIMQLDNGQIWRQVESVAVPIRFEADDHVSVEITRSGFGGYRMNFPELDRRISVSRER